MLKRLLFYIKPTLIDRYIIGKFLSTFFFTLSIFVAIAVVFDYAEKVDDFIRNRAPYSAIFFDYYLNFIPYYCSILSPLIIFIAVIFFTAKMANNTEIVPILSSGASFKRFLYPYFLAALGLALLIFVFNGYLIPHSNKTRIAFENTYMKDHKSYDARNIHMRLDEETYIYMESYNNVEEMGIRFTLEKIKNKELYYKLCANTIQWDSITKHWKIRSYSIRTVNGLHEKMIEGAEKDTLLAFYPSDFEYVDNNFETMTIAGLTQFIEKEKRKGSVSLEPYYMELNKRFSTPFATFILTLIGVALSSRKVRGGIGVHLGIGIFSSFAFIVMNQFSTVFAVKGGMPPMLAAWIPNIVFGIFGLYLLKIAPK